MSKNENGTYQSSEIPSVLCGTTDESFYETPEAKEITRALIEMGREKRKQKK